MRNRGVDDGGDGGGCMVASTMQRRFAQATGISYSIDYRRIFSDKDKYTNVDGCDSDAMQLL